MHTLLTEYHSHLRKAILVVAYLGTVFVNYLANALPIGGVTTGQASDAYPNLFTPAGLTFAIWGLIYLLLGIHTLRQLGCWASGSSRARERLLARVGWYFVVTSLANVAWIFAWHHGHIALSVIIMLTLLTTLTHIAHMLRGETFSKRDELLIRTPFSVYFGWITVATIANITVLLVSIEWNGFGLAKDVWTIIVLCIGALIGTWRTLQDRSSAYGAVLVWAYAGILYKHLAPSGFDGQYPHIILAAAACIGIFLCTLAYLAFRRK